MRLSVQLFPAKPLSTFGDVIGGNATLLHDETTFYADSRAHINWKGATYEEAALSTICPQGQRRLAKCNCPRIEELQWPRLHRARQWQGRLDMREPCRVAVWDTDFFHHRLCMAFFRCLLHSLLHYSVILHSPRDDGAWTTYNAGH